MRIVADEKLVLFLTQSESSRNKYKTNTVAMEESDFYYGGMTWQQMCARLKCKSQLVSAGASVTNIVLYLYLYTTILFVNKYLYLYTNICI